MIPDDPPSQINESLRGLSIARFERLLADVWESQGWQIESTPGERGVVISRKDHSKSIIFGIQQPWTSSVNASTIQQYAEQYPHRSTILVTTSWFTDRAKSLAAQQGIQLVNGSDLHAILKANGFISRLADYRLDATTTDPSIPQSKGSRTISDPSGGQSPKSEEPVGETTNSSSNLPPAGPSSEDIGQGEDTRSRVYWADDRTLKVHSNQSIDGDSTENHNLSGIEPPEGEASEQESLRTPQDTRVEHLRRETANAVDDTGSQNQTLVTEQMQSTQSSPMNPEAKLAPTIGGILQFPAVFLEVLIGRSLPGTESENWFAQIVAKISWTLVGLLFFAVIAWGVVTNLVVIIRQIAVIGM